MTGYSFQQMFARKTAEDAREAGWSFVPPAWIGPPRDELGWAVPLALVVARSERAVVALRHATAYSTGVVLDVVAQARDLSQREAHRLLHERHLYPDEEEQAPGFLRFGVELADGTRASNLGTPHPPASVDDEPEGPVLMQIGGSGGSGDEETVALEERYWLWPLPTPGQLGVYVEWPALEIPLSTADLDTSALRAAAERSTRLWSDE